MDVSAAYLPLGRHSPSVVYSQPSNALQVSSLSVPGPQSGSAAGAAAPGAPGAPGTSSGAPGAAAGAGVLGFILDSNV